MRRPAYKVRAARLCRLTVILLGLACFSRAQAQPWGASPRDLSHASAAIGDDQIQRLPPTGYHVDSDGCRPTVPSGEHDGADEEIGFDDFAWRKGEYSIVPYGIGWLSTAYDTSRTTPGPFVFFVASPDVGGEPSFHVNARPTRVGLEITGPEIGGADSAGRVEFDFQGSAQTENRTGVLLRQAYGEFRTERWRLLGGQSDDVISPLIPNVLNYSVGWAAGNIGFRRAQARAEWYAPMADDGLLTLQGSINQTIVADFVTLPDLRGEDAGWPTIMARAAVSSPPHNRTCQTMEIGISGHIGQEQVDFIAAPAEDDRQFLSWSANVDVRLPLGDRFGVQGEFFVGKVLGTFLGGINQGIDPINRVGIRSVGGWGELWWYYTDRLHSHVGFAIDDPNNSDLSDGRRSRNQLYFANFVLDVTEKFTVGLEASWWETTYIALATGETFRVEAVTKYRF